MNSQVTTVTVLYQDIDGYHFFTSDDVIGLNVGGRDLESAYNDVPRIIEHLMLVNHEIKCTVEPQMTFDEFVSSAVCGYKAADRAEIRSYALKKAA